MYRGNDENIKILKVCNTPEGGGGGVLAKSAEQGESKTMVREPGPGSLQQSWFRPFTFTSHDQGRQYKVSLLNACANVSVTVIHLFSRI